MLLPPKPQVINPSDYFNLLRLKIPETERTCRFGELTAEFKNPDVQREQQNNDEVPTELQREGILQNRA